MKKLSWCRASMIALSLALASVSLAAAAPAQVAEMSVGAASVEWHASGAQERLVLTVSGPDGQVHRQSLDAKTAPSFSLFDAAGNRRPDGNYTWELRAEPQVDAATRQQLAAARAAGRGDAVAAELRQSGKLPAERVQSGSFAILDGSFVGPGLKEERAPQAKPQRSMTPITAADQVIPDDLIVQGSACIGLDCVNNESFGFDTIRLKENNTRIKFDDTSTGTGFPANDWQLTANDSASGGSSKFSIEDITGARVPFTITAGAATNSIFVDSTGRLGLRTATPVLDVHINTSNTPAIRLEQNNSGGFTAQTWDVAGNEANFFVRDVTGGSRLPFRIRPGAPTSSIDISASGDVGIGTASPSNKLDIECSVSGGAGCVKVANSSATGFSSIEFADESGAITANFGRDNSADTFRLNSINSNPIQFLTNSTEHLRLDPDGDVGINCNNPTSDLVIASGGGCANPASSLNAGATAFTATSSRTIKENLEPVSVPNILERISAINVYKYDFINGPKDRLGLMAEDFHQVFQHGSDKLLNGQEVEMALWLAVKELTTQNKELTERLATLEAKLAAEKGQQHP